MATEGQGRCTPAMFAPQMRASSSCAYSKAARCCPVANGIWLICTVSGGHKCLSQHNSVAGGCYKANQEIRIRHRRAEIFLQCTTQRPLADRERQGERISDLRSEKLDELLLTRQTQGCQNTSQQICTVQVYLPLADRVKKNCCELQTHAA